MHAGIYKRTESSRVSPDADSMNGQFRERIENTSMRSRGWNSTWAPTDDVYRVCEYTRTDEKAS